VSVRAARGVVASVAAALLLACLSGIANVALAASASGGTINGSATPVDVLLVPGASPPPPGAGATSSWQAKVGPSGVNGTVSLSTITNGAGSMGLKLVKLRAYWTLPVAVFKGTCTSVGPELFTLAAIRTTSSGAATRTNALSASAVKLILAATAGSGKIAIRVGTGTSARCGAFAKRSSLGPQAVAQAFYNWYIARVSTGTVRLRGRPDVTPAFVYWSEHYSDGQMFGADLILCAQDIPQSAAAARAAISGLSATVNVAESFQMGTQGVLVKLTLAPTGWQISKVVCSS
jgi:hypothetical protein